MGGYPSKMEITIPSVKTYYDQIDVWGMYSS